MFLLDGLFEPEKGERPADKINRQVEAFRDK